MTSALQMANMVREGETTSIALVTAAFDRIAKTDDYLKAWVWLDRDRALATARDLDQLRHSGRVLGPMHGVPFGLKDIIDTADMPTECGSSALAGRQPTVDAVLVSQLKEAGAVILGKTATTPFAFMDPVKTRNPNNFNYSPGGSSSGSAAAVAAGHVPVAIGTQTNGSVIRPASFCGVYGFKPSLGMIPRTGVLRTSETLDQVGVFTRHFEDLAMVSDVISEFDPLDPSSFDNSRPRMLESMSSDETFVPKFVWFEMPYFDQLSTDCREGMMAVINALGGYVEQLDVDEIVLGLVEVQNIIHHYEIARNLAEIKENHNDTLSPKMAKTLIRGFNIGTDVYHKALELRTEAISYFQKVLNDCDAIITPSASGEAPLFAENSTGNPIFSTVWTLCGLPCLTIPALVSENKMPIGLQLVGKLKNDAELLRTGLWLLNKLRKNT
ncbi:amidase [Candidatus Puniceispirillum sp.]|nr:amidase [Candidatus Puniceispirillum sp.]